MQWSGEIDELLKGEGGEDEERKSLPNSLRLNELMEEDLELVRNLISSLKRGEVSGSFASARATANLYCRIFENFEWKSTKVVMDIVRRLAVILGDAAPAELTIGNIARRTLRIIREAYADARKTSIDSEEMGKEKALSLKASTMIMEQGPSLATMLGRGEDDFTQPFDIKDVVLDELEALADEIAVVYKDIAKQADAHINSNEVVLVLGHSSSVEGFLKAAAVNRRFEVFVAEGLPSGNGRYMADRLSKEGISTTLIPDSAIFAIMPRVNKVLSGVHCIMANGVLLALTGTHLLAMAAKQYSVPFVVLTGLYKLCPQYPYPADMDMYSSYRSPAATLPYKSLPSERGGAVKVPSPLYEYVPAELVTLYISEQPHNPSFLYRLLSEYYHPEDYELQ